MKRNLNKLIIISFLVLALILSSITVYAVLNATEFTYNTPDNRNITLAAALDELYNRGVGTSIVASQVKAEDIGAIVKGYKTYEINDGNNTPSDEWQIMYADENNIYLITKYATCNPTDGTVTLNPPVTGMLCNEYSSSGKKLFDNNFNPEIMKWLKSELWNNFDPDQVSSRMMAYMLDESVWNDKYLDTELGCWAIGGPTCEMLCAAYDKYNGNASDSHTATLIHFQAGYLPIGIYSTYRNVISIYWMVGQRLLLLVGSP